jgi:hypothetical protein
MKKTSKNVAYLHNSTKLLSKETPKAPPSRPPPTDPEQLAMEMVRRAPNSRVSGSVALESMTPEQRMKNYVTALGLVAFVTGVWYYSIQAVGKSEGGMDDLREEAMDAMDALDRKKMEEKNAEELAQLDVTLASNYGGDDDVIVAVAAPDEIAQIEENAVTGAGKKKSGRPLWKKVVFFWRRE